MTSEMVYPAGRHNDYTRAMRCRAQIRRRDGHLAQCSNRVADEMHGLCWRHR